jgi:hypothetical protein
MFRLTASVSTYGAKILSTNDDAMMEREKGDWQAIFHTNVKQAPAGRQILVSSFAAVSRRRLRLSDRDAAPRLRRATVL